MEPASRSQMGRGKVRVTLTKKSPFVFPLDKFKDKNWVSGFTIIEILVIVLLMAIIGGISMIQLQPSLRQYRLVSSANLVASELSAGRALAISRNWVYELQCDTDAKTIQVVDPSSGSNAPRVAIYLEPGISFVETPSPAIRFFSRGHSLTGTIVLKDETDETISVIISTHGVEVVL